MTKPGDKWEIERFTILSAFAAPPDHFAAYFDVPEAGPVVCIVEPVSVFATCQVETVEMTALEGLSRSERKIGERNDVVGLVLSDGYFDPCNKFSGFGGLFRLGQDPTGAIGNLKSDPYLNAIEKRGCVLSEESRKLLNLPRESEAVDGAREAT